MIRQGSDCRGRTVGGGALMMMNKQNEVDPKFDSGRSWLMMRRIQVCCEDEWLTLSKTQGET
jgi:hypothetical protein